MSRRSTRANKGKASGFYKNMAKGISPGKPLLVEEPVVPVLPYLVYSKVPNTGGGVLFFDSEIDNPPLYCAPPLVLGKYSRVPVNANVTRVSIA